MLKSMPRVFDNHNHFSLYLVLSMSPSLLDVGDRKKALELISRLPPDRPNLVTGWRSQLYGLTKQDLEGLPPVAVVNFCLHGYVMNGAAAEMASGAGFVLEPADALQAERLMPGVLTYFGGSASPDEGRLRDFVSAMRKLGLYGMEDMLCVRDLPIPDDAGFSLSTWHLPEVWMKAGKPVKPGFKGLKLFADGALGAATAAISSGYTGSGSAVLTHSDDQMKSSIRECFEIMPADAELAIHAIGDLAIGQVLDAIESVAASTGMPADLPRRTRLEHLQFITLEQARRAIELGVTLSMQPNFSSDSDIYRDRISGVKLATNNPFRMLIDQVGFQPGRDLLFGSDGMPHGLVGAIQDALFPPLECQLLTIDELLAGYRADGSFGSVDVEIDYDRRVVSWPTPPMGVAGI